jgi:hypothetical protein
MSRVSYSTECDRAMSVVFQVTFLVGLFFLPVACGGPLSSEECVIRSHCKLSRSCPFENFILVLPCSQRQMTFA